MSKNVYNNRGSNNQINQATDVSVSNLQNNEVLVWNSSVSKWENKNSSSVNAVSSVFGRTGAVIAVEGDYTLNQLADVNSTDESDKQVLKYDLNSQSWQNGRVRLDELQDVGIANPVNNQVIQYLNGLWVNGSSTSALDSTFSVDNSVNAGASVNAVINTTYMCNLGTLNIGNSSTGACIKIINSGADLNIVFSGLVYINGINYFNTTFFTNEICYLELKNYFGGNAWIITNLSPRLYYPSSNTYIYYNTTDLNDLRNLNITSPLNNQILRYNTGTGKWLNSTETAASVLSVFSRTGAVVAASGDYSIGQITNSSTLADNNNLTIGAAVNNEILRYNQGTNKWISSAETVRSVFGRTGVITAAEGDYTLNLLGDVIITTPVNTNLLKYNGTNWVNSADYILKYNTYATPVNSTLTAVVNTLYQSNNCIFNMPINPSAGDIITIFNIEPSTTTTVNFGASSGLYTLSQQNDGAISLSTTEVGAHITFACINSPTYWFIKDISGQWTNSISTKKITSSYVDIQNLKNTNISAPTTGQFLTYDSTLNSNTGGWQNTTLERCHPTSELQVGGVGTTFALTLTTVNVWYQFTHATAIINNPSASGVFALNNANLFQWTYTGTNSKYYHSAFSLSSASNDAADSYECAYFINGVIVSGSQFSVDYVQNNRAISVAFHKVLVLNTNDIIDIRIRNTSAGGRVITSNNINAVNMACCSVN